MDQLRNYADNRLINGCIYCGGPEETREHVPSRVFLDPPFPENLPAAWACRRCNVSYSLDEEYVACLVEVAIAGSTDPGRIRRAGIASTLQRSPALRARLEDARTAEGGQTRFAIEPERVRNVLLKLARGHATYELSRPCRVPPTSVRWWPLWVMTDDERDSYDASHVVEMLSEVGARGQQRLLVTQVVLKSPDGEKAILEVLLNDWVDVQAGRYRYHAIDESGEIRIKIVIGEYLASEIVWGEE